MYETALDNSLWPEMIVSIVDHVNRLEALPEEKLDRARIESINDHFNRAYSISEKMLQLQEGNHEKLKVIGAMSYNVVLLDARSQVFFSSRLEQSLDGSLSSEKLKGSYISGTVDVPDFVKHLKTCQEKSQAQVWSTLTDGQTAMILLPKEEVVQLGFPAKTENALISYPLNLSNAVAQFQSRYGLLNSEIKLLEAFVESSDLRKAASKANITYETARKYIKDIFKKTGDKSQSALIRNLLFSPAVWLAMTNPSKSDIKPVRRMMTLSDKRELEYFSLGPEDGYPVIFIDTLASSAIDVLRKPERYLPRLESLGMRLINPCRHGGFRSTYRPINSLKDMAGDIAELCDRLGFQKVSLLSYSYGSNAALAVGHELPDLIERITMSSVSYMTYSHDSWRDMDLFFHVTNVIGRRWPALLNQLIPFLARSVMQNVHRFADRLVSSAKCEHDRAIILDHPIRERTRDMLMERTAHGMEGLIEEFCINAQPYDFDVRNIKIPMTLLHGEFDFGNPLDGAKLLAEHAPHADLHVLKGMGHHHIFVEWDWIFAAAMGRQFDIPEPTRRPRVD